LRKHAPVLLLWRKCSALFTNNTMKERFIAVVSGSGAAALSVGRVFTPFFVRVAELNARLEERTTPRLSTKEQMLFVKRLAFLVNASVPILESLHMVSEQSKSRRYNRVMKSVIADVTNGLSLSRSFERFPHVFGDFGINIIRIGETSGTLSQNLEYLAEELKKAETLKKKILGAMVYPAVITVATLAITAFLVLYLFPKIMPVFTSLKMELPLSTKIVIAVSTFLQAYGLVTLAIVAGALVVLVFVIRKSPQIRYVFDTWIMRMPIVGEVIRYYNLATATRTLGLLLRSGVTLAEALPLTADTTKNLVYKEQYRLLADAVLRGERISNYLFKKPSLFPAMTSQMIAVGERSGNLSDTLVYLSSLYEAEVDDFTKNLSSLVEPALMVIMGVLVGFVAISIITPIYGITQHLKP
jgi:type II secretory pathway component PulF